VGHCEPEIGGRGLGVPRDRRAAGLGARQKSCDNSFAPCDALIDSVSCNVVLRLTLLTTALAVIVLAYARWLRRRAAVRLDVGAVSQRWVFAHNAEER
jgi:hypothetical protein